MMEWPCRDGVLPPVGWQRGSRTKVQAAKMAPVAWARRIPAGLLLGEALACGAFSLSSLSSLHVRMDYHHDQMEG